jgi:hypothetical protein
VNASSDLIVHYVAVAIAVVFVLIGWLVVAGLVTFFLRRWALGRIAKLPEGREEEGGALRWVMALVSFLFWPTAVVLGIYFLRKPETARTGLWCFYALLAYVTVSVLLADAIVVGVAVLRPEWLMLL